MWARVKKNSEVLSLATFGCHKILSMVVDSESVFLKFLRSILRLRKDEEVSHNNFFWHQKVAGKNTFESFFWASCKL